MRFAYSHAQVVALAQRGLGSHGEVTVVEMPKGASTRRYFRVRVAGASRGGVVLFAPDGDRPEEAGDAGEFDQWPFLEVRGLLAAHRLPVPELLAEDVDHGLLLLEDLGDVTLASALKADPGAREDLYFAAAELAAHMHGALGSPSPTSIIGRRLFGYDTLRWELAHFVEYGLEARGIPVTGSVRERLDAALDGLAAKVASMPRGFVHRDYQSRNLMVVSAAPRPRLVMIDFQDALMGPRLYDLVSLVRDSYQNLDEPFVEEVLRIYARTRGLEPEQATLRRELDLLTVQRKLKDAGRFIFIERVKHDPSFLPYFGPSLGRVKAALERLSGDALLDELHALFKTLLPEHFG